MHSDVNTIANTTLVILLDSHPTACIDGLGCGRELFRGWWQETPAQIAAAVSREIGAAVDVHAVSKIADCTVVMLRWATRYAHVEPRSRHAQRDARRAAERPTFVPPARRMGRGLSAH
jgi:hypothetical protein